MSLDEMILFVKPYVQGMAKSVSAEILLVNGILYMLADNSVVYTMDLSTKIGPDRYRFHYETGNITPVETDGRVSNDIIVKVNQCLSDVHPNNMIFENPDLDQDKTFIDMAFAKAGNGASFYFINTKLYPTFIPVFNGLPLLNKGDKIGLNVYDIGTNKLLINYNIFKKKFGCSYNVYFHVLNVNRPLRM